MNGHVYEIIETLRLDQRCLVGFLRVVTENNHRELSNPHSLKTNFALKIKFSSNIFLQGSWEYFYKYAFK